MQTKLYRKSLELLFLTTLLSLASCSPKSEEPIVPLDSIKSNPENDETKVIPETQEDIDSDTTVKEDEIETTETGTKSFSLARLLDSYEAKNTAAEKGAGVGF